MRAFSNSDLVAVGQHQRAVDRLMAVYGVNAPFIPTFKKALQLKGVIQSDRCSSPFNTLNAVQTQQLQDILTAADSYK